MNAEAQFQDAIRAAGLNPPERVEGDGKLHRFASNGTHGDDSGWYVLHVDGLPAGCFGCWRSNLTATWRAKSDRKFTAEEKAAYRARMTAAKRERDAEEKRRHAKARERASAIWKAAAPAEESHPYLSAKRVKAHGLRVHEGALVVPMRDTAGKLHSLQFIGAAGEKKFLTGGRVTGCYYPIGKPGAVLCIAEGFATSATVHEATGHAVAVAFNAGNLEAVAKALHAKFPMARIVVTGDNDESGTGQRKAEEAARAVGGEVVLPDTTGKDWNDMGPEECSGAIERLVAEQPKAAASAKRETQEALPPEFSEDALALEFTRRHGDDLRYVPPWGKWFRWDGSRWDEDRITRVYDLSREVCRDAAGKAKEKIARQITSAKTVAAVEKLARSDPHHAILPEQLDADLYLFNCPGGTVDLRTGQLRSHRREDMITKVAGATPDDDADDSIWIKFLADITLGDKEIEDYLQRLFGYCLSADVRDHVLAFFHGTGGNGKNTLIDLVLYIVGDYGKPISTATLMEARGERHPTDVANLLGVRLAVSNEIEEGGHWAETKVKALTGDAVLSARFMRQDFFEFKRTHKLIVSGNHRPAIRVVDEAIRRRMHLVPFLARFTGEHLDRDMPKKLQAEAGAVLAWMVRGFLGWQEAGLQPPAAVLTATARYLREEDTLGLWLTECCDTTDPTAETKSGALYANFKAWKENRGERPGSHKRFAAQIGERFQQDDRAGYVWVQGVALKAPA